MRVRVVLILAIAACTSRHGASPPGVMTDASSDTIGATVSDDGFGEPCTPQDNILTPCTSGDGMAGWCAINACRRRCNRDQTGCPSRQDAIVTIEDGCYCVPWSVTDAGTTDGGVDAMTTDAGP